MATYVVGRSIYGNCGEFVIVLETTLTTLEAEAPAIREGLGRASRAGTIAEMGAVFDELGIGNGPSWSEIVEEEFGIDAFDQPSPAGLYRRCVEAFFFCSASGIYDSTLHLDTTACYQDMLGSDGAVSALMRPLATTALHDLDAGFASVEEPIRALESAGHTCIRDDARVQRVFGHLMTDAYLRADERDADGVEVT